MLLPTTVFLIEQTFADVNKAWRALGSFLVLYVIFLPPKRLRKSIHDTVIFKLSFEY